MPLIKRGKIYYIEATVAGLGRLPRLSTRQRNKQTAKDMEAMLRDLAMSGYADLVERVRDGMLLLPTLFVAYLSRDRVAALAALRPTPGDPPLYKAIMHRKEQVHDDRLKVGYDQVLLYAPVAERNLAELQERNSLVKDEAQPITKDSTPEEIEDSVSGLRSSWLRAPAHISELYREALLATGCKPNTVRRTLHRAVSHFLTEETTRGTMLAIMADVKKPLEKDERHEMLEVNEIEAVLALADPEFKPFLGLALTTGIDKGPLLNGFVRHYNSEVGLFTTGDEKTAYRPRTLILRGSPVLENAEYWLEQMIHGKEPYERLTSLTADMVRGRWESLRAQIGRADVRLKDLRGVFATHYLRAGGDPRELQRTLGHSSMAMTLRYVRRMPAGGGALEAIRAQSRRAGLPALVKWPVELP